MSSFSGDSDSEEEVDAARLERWKRAIVAHVGDQYDVTNGFP